jgi:hypothetical protein
MEFEQHDLSKKNADYRAVIWPYLWSLDVLY